MQGELLDERFRIGDRLGAGGVGQVWAAQDERMRRDVAVKVVHPQYGVDEVETQARFQREVQLAARLSHQNIVTVHDWGEVSVDGRQTLFLVMELVHGMPLHRRLDESIPPWPLAVGWAVQIAEALSAAHAQGVVHRDIKPANALLTPDGTVKVLDFGVAKFMGETIGARELTVKGAPLGSPLYMAPEQADGDQEIDHRSDLYSLGCLLYHAVTGRPPFTGSSPWAVLRKQMDATPEPPKTYVEGLPPSLNDLMLNLLAKRAEDRPADAAAVCEILCTLLTDHTLTEPGGSILDITQLGRGHSVSGLILKRAWELLQWVEQTGSARRESLHEARAEASRMLNDALLDATEIRQRTEELRLRRTREIEQLRERARRDVAEVMRSTGDRCDRLLKASEEHVAEAQTKAERVIAEAENEARGVRIRAVKKAEGLLKEAEQKKWVLVQEAEDYRAEAFAAKRMVEETERELEILRELRREEASGEIDRITAEADEPEGTRTFPIPSGPGRVREPGGRGDTEPTEEDYYLVFKKSIDGSYPTSGQFRGEVEATYGITLPYRDADRMARRFTNRHTAELQEDHLA
ncbi:protein kinase [Streptomyces sp. NBC_01239]|uniref:serine/threonine-protein kinase n=1 Tax=Streptomyces sp. NBC_01239 TaxID=2903792 RepID=UPI00224DE774|nr:serine/threonine protein kinase [Streptomyces sp. NBC_01239]MCX4811795.1 protein kinase [Streptomyces sp. NBC_01239]